HRVDHSSISNVAVEWSNVCNVDSPSCCCLEFELCQHWIALITRCWITRSYGHHGRCRYCSIAFLLVVVAFVAHTCVQQLARAFEFELKLAIEQQQWQWQWHCTRECKCECAHGHQRRCCGGEPSFNNQTGLPLLGAQAGF